MRQFQIDYLKLQGLGVDDLDGVADDAPDPVGDGDHLGDGVVGGAHRQHLSTCLVPNATSKKSRKVS